MTIDYRNNFCEQIRGCNTRSEAAGVYAGALLRLSMASAFWKDINEEVMQKWSPSGLEWIKRVAWKLASTPVPCPEIDPQCETLHLIEVAIRKEFAGEATPPR